MSSHIHRLRCASWSPIASIFLLGAWTSTGLSELQDNPEGGENRDVYPRIEHVGLVHPNILAIEFINGKRIPGKYEPYVAAEGDEIKVQEKKPYSRKLYRDGQEIGYLVGPEGDQLRYHDTFEGVELEAKDYFLEELYSVSSNDDPAYTQSQKPVKTALKSKPIDFVQSPGWNFDFANRGTLYLYFDQPLKEGNTYRIESKGPLFEQLRFSFHPSETRSNSVHVSHAGFRPKDPVKFATVSAWNGTGGGVEFPDKLSFSLVDTESGETVYQGENKVFKQAKELDDSHPGRRVNLNLADAYRLDFSDFSRPGTYRVVVDGIGASYPFPVAENVWEELFKISAKGMFFQRASQEIKTEHGGRFVRPLNFHPSMGKTAVRSEWEVGPLLYSPGKSISQGKSFDMLDQHATTDVVADAWGGHFDAADFDRKQVHLIVPMYYMELYRLQPDYFNKLTWNIPESGNNLPDILDEAQWGLDVWKRLQTPEGGVPGWIESTAHPRGGETSWQDSLDLFVTSPEVEGSYHYAAAATRFANLVESFDAEMAEDYAASGLRAFEFAEKHYQEDSANPLIRNPVKAMRNLAALELYAKTGEPKYHDVFLEDTLFTDAESPLTVWKPKKQGGTNSQDQAAFAYVSLDLPQKDPTIAGNARQAILDNADWAAEFAKNTSNGFSKYNETSHIGWGTMGAPQATNLIRAYRLTKDPKYLKAAITATQFMLGNNNDNMAFTTGVGSKSPESPLIVDHRKGNLPIPPGITLYGPWDNKRFNKHWGVRVLKENAAVIPEFEKWPASESYFDVGRLLSGQTEYTIQQTMVKAGYFWGGLAIFEPEQLAPEGEPDNVTKVESETENGEQNQAL